MRTQALSVLVALASLGVVPRPAIAVTFSVPLPDLVGPVDFFPGTGGREAKVDLVREFSEIHNVWIEVKATVRAREFDVCGTTFDPQPCVHVVQLLGFFARMDDEDSPVLGTVSSEGLDFSDNREDLEGSGLAIAPFNGRQVGWDFLLDGEGSLTLFWNRLLGNPDRIVVNVVEPSGEIFDARLIVDAVPELSAWQLLSVVLLSLGGRRWIVRSTNTE